MLLPTLSSGMVPKMEACLRAVAGRRAARARPRRPGAARAAAGDLHRPRASARWCCPTRRTDHCTPAATRWERGHDAELRHARRSPSCRGAGRPRVGRRRPRVPRLRRRHRGLLARPRPPGGRRGGRRAGRRGSRTRPTCPCTSPACGWPSGWSSCSALPARVFFANSGAEANECALKLARPHGTAERPRRDRRRRRQLPRPHARRAVGHRQRRQARAVRAAARAGPLRRRTATRRRCAPQSTARTAAVILEPTLGEGGVVPPPAGLPRRGARGLRRAGALLDRRRGAERHRPHRPLVRQSGRGRAPGRHHPRQGPRRRAADRRLPRRRRRRRAVRCRATTAARSAAIRCPARRRSPC